MTDPQLAERYGRRPLGPRARRAWIAVAAAVIAIACAVIVVVAFTSAANQISVQTTGQVHSPEAANVRFAVSATSGHHYRCSVEARDDTHAIVGYALVDGDSIAETTRTFRVEVVTQRPSVAASVSECWITD